MSCGDFSEVHMMFSCVQKTCNETKSLWLHIVDKSFFTGSIVSTFGIYKLKHFLELKWKASLTWPSNRHHSCTLQTRLSLTISTNSYKNVEVLSHFKNSMISFPVFYTNALWIFWSQVSDTVTPEQANHQHWCFWETLILNTRVSFFKLFVIYSHEIKGGR